jgi:hypothetical protein
MGKTDYDVIIDAYKSMVESLQAVNASLVELVDAQQETIIRLQTIQAPKPIAGADKENK